MGIVGLLVTISATREPEGAPGHRSTSSARTSTATNVMSGASQRTVVIWRLAATVFV